MNNMYIDDHGNVMYGRRLPDYNAKQGISCQYPIVIYHPYFRNRFARFKRAWLNGRDINLSTYSSKYIIDNWNKIVKAYFAIGKVNPDISKLDAYFIYSKHSLSYPIYLSVPCGKCLLCTQSKTNDLMNRCRLETWTSQYKPLFITLTYDDEHKPVDGVSLSDCQKFIKRLRFNLDYSFGTHINLRYVICSEYGKNTHRPHYHMILWNMPYFKDRRIANESCVMAARLGMPTSIDYVKGFNRMVNFIRDSWKNGFVSVQVAKDPSGGYLMKYVGKGSFVPKGMNPTFIHWSRRRGIGYEGFERLKQQIIDNPSSTKVSFFDPKVGKVQEVTIPKYYERLICPSPSSVSPKFIQSVKDFFWCARYYLDVTDYRNKLTDPMQSDVLDMCGDIKKFFEPFRDSLYMDTFCCPDKFNLDYCDFVHELSFDVCQGSSDQIYWYCVGYYQSLLSWIQPLLNYCEIYKEWKPIHSFVKQEAILDDNRLLCDKVYQAECNYNNILKKCRL